MNTHHTGPLKGSRLGTACVVHTFPVTFNDLTAVAKKLCTIAPILNPSPGVAVFEPEMYVVDAIVEIPNNAATSAALAVGAVGGTYVDSIAAFDMKGAAGANATRAANPIKLVLADTDIFALPTIVGAPTAGKCHVIITMWGTNVNEPTNQGS